ncbi:MAG: hypothetical protein JEZ07_18360 [Phycisphaerae bacterium]|nr:hypothetical protein [Phycisphaerae bacterium]
MGRAGKLTQAYVKLEEVLNAYNHTSGGIVVAGGIILGYLNEFNKVPGMSDMIEFYSDAMMGIGNTMDKIAEDYGEHYRPMLENCNLETVPQNGAKFGKEWMYGILAERRGTDFADMFEEQVENACCDSKQ